MKFTVKPSVLNGETFIPASKSHTIRSVFIASLAEGESKIINPLESADGRSSVAACRTLGTSIQTGKDWIVDGTGGNLPPLTTTVDVGNSGTSARFVLGMAALGHKPVFITGDDQTRKRPMGPLLEALSNLGADAKSDQNNGCLPATVSGRLKGGATTVSGITSQFISSLLINCPLADGDSEITVPFLNEKPYVEMTLRWLDSQGIQYENHDFKRFLIKGNQRYKPFTKAVPADFSSATFFLCAASFTESDILLKGLDMTDSQGDKMVVKYLKEMGAQITLSEKGIRVQGSKLKGIEIDMNETPDALPAMAVAGTAATGKTVLRNVHQARLKETDRIAVMCQELRKLGASIEELEDGLIIKESKLTGSNLMGNGDHRVVMSLTTAGLIADGETTIHGAEAVGITFPTFQTIMQDLGANITEE